MEIPGQLSVEINSLFPDRSETALRPTMSVKMTVT